MAGIFVIGSKFKVFVDGIAVVAGTAKVNTRGASEQKLTTEGVFLAATTAMTTVDLNEPVFSASPIEIVELAQKLTATSGVLTLVDLVNGTTRSFTVMINDKSESWDSAKAAECDWTFNVGGEPIKA